MPGDTQLKALEIQPGINRNQTSYQTEGVWIDGQLVRFPNGNPEKMGGWQKVNTVNSFYGLARDIVTWTDLDSNKYAAIGTECGLFVYSGGDWYDITPVRVTTNISSHWSTTNGSNIVEVSQNAHGAVAGDHIFVATEASVSTLRIAGRYTVVSAATNTFQVAVTATVGFTVAGVGTSAQLWYHLECGRQSNETIGGYGAGTYGSGTYGVGTSSTALVNNLRTWSLEPWGEDLLASHKGGKVYLWDESLGLVGNRAKVISGAPTKNNFIMVAEPTKHLICCGTSTFAGNYDNLTVRWSSNEDYTQFSPAVTNASGEIRLRGGSGLIGGIQAKEEMLLFTDEGLHVMYPTNDEFFFGFDKKGGNCGLVGQNALAESNGIVYWMGHNAFFYYDGTVHKMPCTLNKAIFESMSSLSYNYDQKDKIYAGTNTEFNEIIWFYPGRDSTENDRYIVYNYLEDTWYDGPMSRTTWSDADIFERPIATATSTNVMYEQEIGHDADGQPLASRLKSSFMDIDDGQEIMFVDRFIPDFNELATNNLKLTVHTRKYPNGDVTTKGPYNISTMTKKINFRARGREIAVEFNVSAVGSNFSMGKQRIGFMPDGHQ